MLRTLGQSVFSSRLGIAAFLGTLMVMVSTRVHADLLAYDPFAYGDPPAPDQYAVGDEDAGTGLLGGQNPPIGPTAFYSGPWIQSGGDSQVVKALPSLAYPGLAAGVGGIQQESLQFDCCTFGRSARAITGGLGGGSSQLIYESFLIDLGLQGTDASTDFGFRGHELWNGGVGDAFRAIGLFVNHFSSISDLTLEVTTASGSAMAPLSGGGLDIATLAGVHLVVMKYEFNPISPDVVSVFLDPVIANGEPLVPAAQISVPTSDLLITHQGAYTQFTFSGSGHIPGAIDEIRWGDSFADVTPLPEPGALAVLVGLVAGLRRRRR